MKTFNIEFKNPIIESFIYNDFKKIKIKKITIDLSFPAKKECRIRSMHYDHPLHSQR